MAGRRPRRAAGPAASSTPSGWTHRFGAAARRRASSPWRRSAPTSAGPAGWGYRPSARSGGPEVEEEGQPGRVVLAAPVHEDVGAQFQQAFGDDLTEGVEPRLDGQVHAPADEAERPVPESFLLPDRRHRAATEPGQPVEGGDALRPADSVG